MPLFLLSLFFIYLYLVIETGSSLSDGLGGWAILIFIFCILVAFVISDSHNRIRPIAILLMTGLTILATYIINKYLLSGAITNNIETIIGLNGFWTFFAVIVSAPTLFVIWHFRDVNNAQERENQRKDINLKEFQKIAEWVSGFHFDEDKNEEDNKDKEGSKNETIDENIYDDFGKKISTFATYSKRDGAIALQVSSVYSLQPFLHGDYGEYFIIPSLNLLKQSLQMLYYHHVEKLDFYYGKECYNEKYKDIIFSIRQRACGAMGIALAQVLLAENNKYLLRRPDNLSLLYLSGIDFNLFGLRENIKEDFFYKLKNVAGIRLLAAILNEVIFIECNITKADFRHADLYKSYFYKGYYNSIYFNFANLDFTVFKSVNIKRSGFNKSNGHWTQFINCDLRENNMQETKFVQASFIKCKLSGLNFSNSELSGTYFENSNMEFVNLSKSNLCYTKFKAVNLNYANLQDADILGASFTEIEKMLKTNLVNVEHAYLKEFLNIKYISGSIIDFKDEFYKEDVDNLKSKGMVFLIGKRVEILTPHKSLELSISSQKFGIISHTYEIFSFEIDLQKTEEFNPDWTFILISKN